MYDFENAPVGYCECCGGEIYGGDEVYDMNEVYSNGRHIIHEECLLDSLEEVLTKQYARDVFDWRYNDE